MKASRFLVWTAALRLILPTVWAAGDSSADQPVVLPPFLVEEHYAKASVERVDWIYWRGEGFEVLSGCPEDETEQFIREVLEQRQAFNQFIPDDLLFRTTLPTTLILFPKSEKARIDGQLLKDIKGIPHAATAASQFEPLDDLRLSDADSSFIFVILDDWKWGWDIRHGYPKGSSSALFYSPAFLQFLLAARVPALPSWFVAGSTRLYASMVFSNRQSGALTSVFAVPTFVDRPWERTQFLNDPWTSPAAAAALRGNPSSPRALLPLAELFQPHFDTEKSDSYRGVWTAESELLVRWAFSDRVKGGRDHLRQLLEGLAAHPPSEELFQSCFGMGYADARDALSDFLPQAVAGAQNFATTPPPENKDVIEIREASVEQVHRIKGEWSRRALRMVRANFPAALPLYAAEAKATLQGSFDKGERDPQLVASLALFDLDKGDSPLAGRLLEENPDAVAVRPSAALALAQVRFEAAVAAHAADKAPLTPSEADRVLAALAVSFRMAPPLETCYALEANVIGQAARDPSASERSRLNEGSRLFPRNSRLLLQTISWDLRAGDPEAAKTLIAKGKAEAHDTRMRARFTILEELTSARDRSEN